MSFPWEAGAHGDTPGFPTQTWWWDLHSNTPPPSPSPVSLCTLRFKKHGPIFLSEPICHSVFVNQQSGSSTKICL